MSDSELTPQPDPHAETSRLDRIEARLAALEDRIAGAGAALPPPRDPEPAAAATSTATTSAPPGTPAFLEPLADFVRNNPVLSLIGAIVVLVVLSHLFG
ncbi:hypothetical protein [Niveispirillum cyanobacteriorum]|uniref:Uncharacterized protein n=1 Tax=Niveispirillum cyanobacteriorum TaxID=1612173 RepID=A0A2K9N7H6_9PROT|nr:hypothetical protein [Niveispirillum cyanobacteriorum]AUN29103.1 hypothetical protein C0V82_01700 [Niveispirillum cyanobacteriorum]GGE67472.1 hypothetical protein GCM10011317_25930 [Niveispirillum cyanobacteriorum]